jgi:hypothetical protein
MPALVAKRLGKRLAERDAGILDGVVVVDVEVALRADGQVDQAVAGELVQHVVEEADAGLAVIAAVPSRLTVTEISVSAVLRVISALRMGCAFRAGSSGW